MGGAWALACPGRGLAVQSYSATQMLLQFDHCRHAGAGRVIVTQKLIDITTMGACSLAIACLLTPSCRSSVSSDSAPSTSAGFDHTDTNTRTRRIRDSRLNKFAWFSSDFAAAVHFVSSHVKFCRLSRPSVLCMAPHKGRVGVYKREGNVSLASFGIKVKRNKHGRGLDVTKSLSKLLPYVVVATAACALTHPASFAWVSKEYYAPALGGIMLSIGVQLSLSDFALVFKRPLSVLVGYTGQYAIKPLLGYGVATAFNVSPAFAAGLILTSCVAGAQLSSYAAYLSEGDVAFSIVLTSLTTISSVFATPLLTKLLIGSVVPVDVVAMSTSILQVVICPVMLGLLLNSCAKSSVDKIRPFMPLVAMVCTSLCIGSPLALNRGQIISAQGFQLLLPVLVFHIAAFVMGYCISKLPFWRQEEKLSKTITLCTGMQSSTLAMLLATQFLGGSHAVPPACSVVIMAVMGLSLATFWGKGKQVTSDLAKKTLITRNLAGLLFNCYK